MQINSIGIIGGTNGLGARLADYFEVHFPDKKCLVSGRNTDVSSKKIVQECDLVLFAVPIAVTLEVMESLLPESRSDQIWADITSVKQAPVDMMLRSKAQVCGLHPLFGPLTSIAGQPVIYCPERIETNTLKSLLNLLVDFDCLEMTPKEHDDTMGLVQCVSHLSDFVMGETLQKAGLDFSKVWQAASPSYRTKLQVMARMFAQSPELYVDIALQNPSALKFDDAFLQAASELRDLIALGDREALIKRFRSVGQYLTKDFCDESYAQTQSFMSLLAAESPVDKSTKTGEIAIFGDRFSHTDIASWQFFPNRDDQPMDYFSAIDEVCAAVSEGRFVAGVLPYENSNHGVVIDTLDSLFRYENLHITEHRATMIDHHLLATANTSLAEITHIHSHPQALAQSREWLSQHLPKASLVPAASTALAAQELKANARPGRAVIGNKALADGLGLTVLAENIQLKNNVTRFIKIATSVVEDPTSNCSSLVFWFGDDQAGNLAGVLQFLADNHINLIRLDSRRSTAVHGEYLFFVDALITHSAWLRIENEFASLVAGYRVLGHFSVRQDD